MKVLRSLGLYASALVVAVLLALVAVRPASGQPHEGPQPAVSGTAPPAAPPAIPAPSPLQRPPFGVDLRGLGDGSQIVVTVLTFSPGDHPFFKFGHSAILIHDPVPPKDRRLRPWMDTVYNWGGFAFEDPAVIPKFFQGRFMYWLDIEPLGATIPAYQREGRAIYAQELDLTPAEKLDLEARLEENAKPENRKYKYDYYRDNCATRVRDEIDAVVAGRVKEASIGKPARLTYRGHTLRLTESFPAEEVTLNLVMGDFIDKPATVWDEGFIPMELQKTLRTVTVANDDGTEKPLVKREYTITPTKNADPPDNPPTWWPYSLATGLLLGGLMAALGFATKKTAVARVAFGGFLSLFGFVFGFLGIFFLAAWALTDHVVGYHNENVMLCAPWAIAFTGSGLRIAFGGRYNKWLAWGYRAVALVFAIYVGSLSTLSIGIALALLLGAASVGLSTNIRIEEKLVRAATVLAFVATVVKILPWFDQKNGFFIVFFVPFWIGAAIGIKKVREKLDADARAASDKKEAEEKARALKADGARKADGKKRKKKRPEEKPADVEEKPAPVEEKKVPDAEPEDAPQPET